MSVLNRQKVRKFSSVVAFQIEQTKRSGVWAVVLECVTRLAHHLNAFVFFTSHLLFVERHEFRVIQRSDNSPSTSVLSEKRL